MVLYCDVTSLFFVFVCKPFAMDEELYQYELRSPRLPDSPPGVCAETPPGEVSWTDDDPMTIRNVTISVAILRAQLWT